MPTTRGAAARSRPRVSAIPRGTATSTTITAETKVSLTCSQISWRTVGQASCDCSTESRVAVWRHQDVAEEHQRDQDRRQHQHQHGLARQAAQAGRGRGWGAASGAVGSPAWWGVDAGAARRLSHRSRPSPGGRLVRRWALCSCSSRMWSVTASKPITPRLLVAVAR